MQHLALKTSETWRKFPYEEALRRPYRRDCALARCGHAAIARARCTGDGRGGGDSGHRVSLGAPCLAQSKRHGGPRTAQVRLARLAAPRQSALEPEPPT